MAEHKDPYPAIGTNYRPNIQPSTTNRGLTLSKEQVEDLRDLLEQVASGEPVSTRFNQSLPLLHLLERVRLL